MPGSTGIFPRGRRLSQLALRCVALASASCVGRIETPPPPRGAGAPDVAAPSPTAPRSPPNPGAPSTFSPGVASVRLLTVTQYQNALRDLLGASVVAPPIEGWHTSLQGAQGGISPQLVEQLEAGALGVARTAFTDEAGRARLVGCDPRGAGAGRGDDCAAGFLRGFLRRAWRRPVTEAELTRYLGVARGAASALGDPWRGLEMAVVGALQSPHFLFRAEIGQPVADGRQLRRFTDVEMASRLSFFLWNAPPDEVLLTAAERGGLATRAGVTAQVKRLLASPRARHGILQMFEDVLDLHSLPSLQKDPGVFPAFDAALAEAMRQEVVRSLEDHLFVRGGDVRDLFVRRDTFVNNALATLYGLPVQAADGFRAATWPDSNPRAGLLGFAGLLALQANQLSASPTVRGKTVREAYLCLPTPPPPPGVDTTLPPVNGDQKRTTRQRLSEHEHSVTCAACHALMDPIGFALEQFDAIGRFRAQENGLNIDPSGKLEGVAFADASALGGVLRDHRALGPCFARQLYRHAVGRFEAPGEETLIAALADALAGGQHRILAVAEALATSESFRLAADSKE